MNVMITGGAGFLGLRLARALLRDGLDGRPVGRLILVDRTAPRDLIDGRVCAMVGDIADHAFLASLPVAECEVLYHLAAVVSGEAEDNFDLGMRVNVDAARLLLECARASGHRPRLVFTSSVAVFGPLAAGEEIDDRTAVSPRSSYGTEKAIAELLLQDYARRDFVDGVVLRLPTISVRPGRPNQAASSFASGIVREPLAGVEARCPVPAATQLWLLSPRRATEALMLAAELPSAKLAEGRILNLPGISVTAGEMVETLAAIAGRAALDRVRWEPDPAIERIVASWPPRWDDSRARALGFRGDSDFAAIVRAYIEDDMQATTPLDA